MFPCSRSSTAPAAFGASARLATPRPPGQRGIARILRRRDGEGGAATAAGALPERTDAGKTAAPELGPVYTLSRSQQQPWQRLNHAEMRGVLRQAQPGAAGDLVVCAGCGREMELPFMTLDNVTPK